jgi:hypothetical protein
LKRQGCIADIAPLYIKIYKQGFFSLLRVHLIDVYWVPVPFANPRQLSIHFVKHAHKFGLNTEREYEEMADAFMSQPLNADLFEGISPYGSLRRYRLHGTTLYFGIAVRVTVIITFHPRDPYGVARRGGPAGFIAHQCSQVK